MTFYAIRGNLFVRKMAAGLPPQFFAELFVPLPLIPIIIGCDQPSNRKEIPAYAQQKR